MYEKYLGCARSFTSPILINMQLGIVICIAIVLLGISSYGATYINGNDDNTDADWEKFCRGTDNNIIARTLPGLAAIPLLSPVSFISTENGDDGFFQCPFPEAASAMRLMTIIFTICWSAFSFTDYSRRLSLGALPWKITSFMFFVMWVADCIYVSNGDNFCEEVVRANFESMSGFGMNISIECKTGTFIVLLFFEVILSGALGFLHTTWTIQHEDKFDVEGGISDPRGRGSLSNMPESDSPIPTKSI